MKQKSLQKLLAIALSASMSSTLYSAPVFAEEEVAEEPVVEQTEVEEVVEDEETPTEEVEEIEIDNEGEEEEEEIDEEGSVEDFETFMELFKVLEQYANQYVASNPKANKVNLITNFIRTGVERYQSGSWQILAGLENKTFTAYVQAQDEENDTHVMDLKNLENMALPNGDIADIGHMFGTMDIISNSIASGNDPSIVELRADLGGWAGDCVDLLSFVCTLGLDGEDVDALADKIRAEVLGAEKYGGTEHTFSQTDIFGDLDGFYMMNEVMKGNTNLTSLISNRLTAGLTDKDRADYFLKNRFENVRNKANIRKMALRIYEGNNLLSTLEASRTLNATDTQRKASVYAWADYLFELAGDDNAQDPNIDPDQPEEPEEKENPYYEVFSSSSSYVAPGITQTIKKALTVDKKQLVYYIGEVDSTRSDIQFHANYANNDPSKGWAMQRVSDQMAAAQARHTNPEDPEHYVENYNAVMGINGDFYNMTTGVPTSQLLMEGVEYHGGGENFFGVLKDGTVGIFRGNQYASMKSQLAEAIAGNIMLVENGEMVNKDAGDYTKARASRTAIGMKPNGTVVLVVYDGRQEPFSCGASTQEMAQVMLDAGCEIAMAFDGGGSSTFCAKPEGSDHVSVVNRPSDGYERSVSSSLFVVSTAKVSNEFDHAIITTPTDYITAGSTFEVECTGVSETGNTAEIPENAVLTTSDTKMASISNGVFTAKRKGDVEIQMLVDGKVVGSKTISIVVPDALRFEKETMDVVFEEPTTLPLLAFYNGNPVTYCADDVEFELSNDEAGWMEELEFIGDPEGGVRNVRVKASLMNNSKISASILLALFDAGEAKYDFDNTMFGNRTLAWNREVSNSTETHITDEGELLYTYSAIDPEKDMTTAYTFGVDMSAAPIPDNLQPLVPALAGGDLESATAWNLLLQLAERVSTKTNVTVDIQFDKNVDVDLSNVKIATEYFELTDVKIDENNKAQLTVRWKNQTEAIPADTANPVVILSGVTVTPKAGAKWDQNEQLKVVNTGSLTYDIYLGAGAAYSLAMNPAYAEQYGIIPYSEPENNTHPNGAHFIREFAKFADTYTLDKSVKEGWTKVDGELYYFKDNSVLTGIQKLPGYKDEENEYWYDLGEDGIYTGKLNGLFDYEDGKYYAVNGVLQNSWRIITNDEGEDEYYYFSRKDYKAVNGEQNISGYDYVFEDYVLTKGCWLKDENGIRYVWAGKIQRNQWFKADGNEYFAYTDTYIATGIAKTLNHERTVEDVYAFTDEGVWLGDLTGFYDYNGATYLIKEGVRVQYPGLIEVDGSYYYFNSSNTMVKGRDYFVSKNNGLMPNGTYTFAEDGKMVFASPEEKLNGIIKDGDTWTYYEDGAATYAGLIQIDGDYYYVKSDKTVIHDRSYFVSKTNDLLPQGTYEFDKDGKLVLEKKEGIVKEADGWFYYVDGVKTYAGLIQIDGDYYYVKSDKTVVHDRSYFVSKTNGLLPQGTYEFDKDGKMIIVKPEDKKNGIVKDGDVWTYYVDGVATYAGLIKIDGSYYYVKTDKTVIHGRDYFVSKTNDLLPQGTYTFDAEGKIVFPETKEDEKEEVLNGIVKDGDVWTYYVDGVATYAGLIEIDGDYYYVKTNKEVIHGRDYFVSKTNDLLPAGTYTFGEDGKMVK